MVSWILKKVVGSKNQREIRRLRPLLEKINRLEQEYAALSEEQLREKTAAWKAELAQIEIPKCWRAASMKFCRKLSPA